MKTTIYPANQPNGYDPRSEQPFPDNYYLSAVMKAMREFIIEECQGGVYTEMRLMKKIESARSLFADEKRKLIAL